MKTLGIYLIVILLEMIVLKLLKIRKNIKMKILFIFVFITSFVFTFYVNELYKMMNYYLPATLYNIFFSSIEINLSLVFAVIIGDKLFN